MVLSSLLLPCECQLQFVVQIPTPPPPRPHAACAAFEKQIGSCDAKDSKTAKSEFYQALCTCSALFGERELKDCSKRIFLFTDSDAPDGENKDLTAKAKQKGEVSDVCACTCVSFILLLLCRCLLIPFSDKKSKSLMRLSLNHPRMLIRIWRIWRFRLNYSHWSHPVVGLMYGVSKI